ncbi:MAG: hypothetical protein M5U34_08675 [Chloroflexi bacterium]|nr:hypothetical protein [Chloroflexota bacterium]
MGTRGAFALYWQGAAAGLTNESEDINGIWLDTFTNKLYLTTTGPFSTPATSGDGADIFACYTSGECENGRYWNGSAHGLGAAQVDGLSLMSFPVCTRHGGILNCSFESGFNDWDVQPGSPDTESWTLSGADAHTGQYSALAQATFPDSGDSGDGAILQSPLIPINSTNKEYRFNFYVKTIDNDGWQFRVDFSVNWYLNGGYIGETILNPINVSDDFDWHLKGQTVFVCPAYVGANGARIVFEVSDISLVGTSEAASTSNQLFLDDVIVESRPSICPLLNQ